MNRALIPTLDDFPSDRANCATCTRKGGSCARSNKNTPNGIVRNSMTGDVGGIIYRCQHYTGQYEKGGRG